jgi:hypothetical protein
VALAGDGLADVGDGGVAVVGGGNQEDRFCGGEAEDFVEIDGDLGGPVRPFAEAGEQAVEVRVHPTPSVPSSVRSRRRGVKPPSMATAATRVRGRR